MSLPKSTDPELIVFGGSFDPPHQGHQELALLARTRFPQSQIVVVPAFRPVVSTGVEKANHAAFADRVAMTKLAWSVAVEQGWLTVSSVEVDLPVPSYSLRTLETFAANYGHMALLIGLDQLKSFPRWHQPLEILKIADLIVGTRRPTETEIMVSAGDVSEPGKTIIEIAKCITSLGLQGAWNSQDQHYRLDGMSHVIHFAGTVSWPVSSTEIRECVDTGKEIPRDWVGPEVSAYLRSHGLYKNERGLKAQ